MDDRENMRADGKSAERLTGRRKRGQTPRGFPHPLHGGRTLDEGRWTGAVGGVEFGAMKQGTRKGADFKECKTVLKAGIVALLLVFAGTVVQAQDRLEPARGYPADYPLFLRFYEQETWRLLHVRNATWGVICLPSFFPESSIVYDERAQALVLTAVEGTTLWRNVTQATVERIDKGRFIDIVPLDEPRNYQTPSLKTTVLPVSGTLAQKLERLWNAILAQTEKNGMHVCDGCTWLFFANGKRGKVHAIKDGWTRVPRLVKLADGLRKAIVEQDEGALEALEKEVDLLQRLFEEGKGTAPDFAE